MPADTLLPDFADALDQFELALGMPAENDVVRAGCIQYFEFTFELAWKTIKTVLESQGVTDTHTPRTCLKHAFAMGWIDDEEIWLAMLSARNRMSHTYNARQALVIYDSLKGFSPVLRRLHPALKKALDQNT